MVYCKECRHVFPEYKLVGQRIKDAAPNPFDPLKTLAKAVVRVYFEGPLALIMETQHWEAVLNLVEVAKIRAGSRRDALNHVKFPCPICKTFSHWKREKGYKGSVIRPGDPNWRGGSDRLLLE
jgi:hypothetical protein